MVSKNKDIQAAIKVFELEIEGLKALEKWLDSSFVKAIDILFNTKGRVILSGMGKSGHVAKKISATLASTGTPSFFVHPGEASHGDLGMITKEDSLVLLSNSGETAELKDMINYAKRFDIPLIGIVRRESSVLVDASTVPLILPAVPEACTVNAPTTSTTMMLALGDALAIALLERRGFDKHDFNIFHPGGKLGAAFMKVEDLMHKGSTIPLVEDNILMSDALIEMTKKSLGCLGVINKKKELIGVITDGDLRRHMSEDFTKKKVKDVMSTNPLTIAQNELVTGALNIMESRSITNLFVTDNKKPVGVLHIHDILRAGVV